MNSPPRLREAIFGEIKAHTLETDLSVPTRLGEFWYYSRSFEGKQYGVHCRCPIAGPEDWTPPQLDTDTEVPGVGRSPSGTEGTKPDGDVS